MTKHITKFATKQAWFGKNQNIYQSTKIIKQDMSYITKKLKL